MFSFIETRLFTRLVLEYLTDEEYGALQESLMRVLMLAQSFRPPAASVRYAGRHKVAVNAAGIASFIL